MTNSKENSGKLTIVPTPIGNLGDMTKRAIDALRDADIVYAEDTRVTGKLLSALGIDSKRMLRLDENVMAQNANEVADKVASGALVAYCTDAGMPGVSDPGLRLVSSLRSKGLSVEVLPGPSAALTAYVLSGTTFTSFFFGGFLPKKENERDSLLASLAALDAALIFYESPKRLVKSLESVAVAFPHRDVVICRELTKLHEETFRDSSTRVLEEFKNREASGGIKGEIVLVIEGPSENEEAEDLARKLEAAKDKAKKLAVAGKSQKSIANSIKAEFGISRNDAYDIALEAKAAENDE